MEGRYLPPEIIPLLQEVCNHNIAEFDVAIQEDNGIRQGYLGEITYISLKNKNTGETLHCVIKQGIAGTSASYAEIIANLYYNEISFYKNIWKEFEEFRQKFSKSQPFNKIPKIYSASNEPGKEKLVLENLKYLGFESFPRTDAYDDSQTKLLLEVFGQFHGISAAFREHNSEEFKSLTEPLKNSAEGILNIPAMKLYFSLCLKQMHELVKDEKLKEKLSTYCEKGIEKALDSLKYGGKNPVLNHGDCWSSNIMFKYDENGKTSDIRIIDFQLCCVGSVVTDLSYLLYSGATKDVLNNLDEYLKIYYNSFSNTLRSFHLNPQRIFTFQDLKKEWKEHFVFGFIMGQSSWCTKLWTSFEIGNVVDIDEEIKGKEEEMDLTIRYEVDVDRLSVILSDIVEHLYNNDFL